MANPLKILTVLTASEAAQFKKAVELSGSVTARDGVTVSAGNVDVSAGNLSVVGNMSGSGTLQVGGAATFASPVTASYITNLHNIKSDGVLEISGCVWINEAVTVTGTLGVVDTIVAYAGVNANSQKITMLADGTNPSDATNFLQLSNVATTASANLTAASGALKTYIDAQNLLQDLTASAFSGAIKTYVDARDTAVSGALKTYADALDSAQTTARTTLSGAVSSSLAAESSARAAEDLTFLKLDGSRPMTGNLNASSVQVSASSLNVGGAAYVGGDLSVQGNLQVLGNIDAISRSDLYVTDAVIMVASGAANAAAANGAGLEVDGADASFKYASSGDRWLANKDMEVSAAYFAGGQKLLEKASIGAAVGAKLAYSDYGYVGIANFFDGDGVLIAGKSIVGVEATNFTLRATGSFEKQATFQAQVGMDAALKLSGSAFTYIATPIVSNKYDVNDAIRALDVAVSGAVNAGSSDLNTLKSNYDGLRQVVTGTLSSGTALLTLAGAQFAAGEIDNLALDVMIDADNTGYTNDLVAIKMYVDGAAVKVQIDAPAAASAKYRLIVVNEADGKL